jgi:hydroxymethylpyrimidine pyrophosphatase-like HAD family hydrolase
MLQGFDLANTNDARGKSQVKLHSNFRALATDYDGTLASNGKVLPGTLTALVRVRLAERKLILVTGRELPSLLATMPQIGMFSRVVAENGAVLYRPSTKAETRLSAPSSPELVSRLRTEGVLPLSVGQSVIATLRIHKRTVLRAIQEMGLDLKLSMNRESMMILPTGVNKATGLEAALEDIVLSFSEVVGIGDAENDLTFLGRCGFSVAVANALPMVKSIADMVTRAEEGAGVAECIDRLLAKPPAGARRKPERQPC